MATYHFGDCNHEQIILILYWILILFSVNTFSKVKKHFELAFIPYFSHTSYYYLQKDFLFRVVNEVWVNEEKEVVSKISQPHLCVFSGDRRCDSPVQNAKCFTYTFLEHSINQIVAMSVTQFNECGNWNRMEKYGFQKVLHNMDTRDITIKPITTDRHVQIKKLWNKNPPVSAIRLTFGMFAKTLVEGCQKLLKRNQQPFYRNGLSPHATIFDGHMQRAVVVNTCFLKNGQACWFKRQQVFS